MDLFEDHLHIFSQCILNQLVGDATYEWFDPRGALCINWRAYLENAGFSGSLKWSLQDLLTDKFAKLYGSTGYPFGGVHTYTIEVKNRILYRNPMRLDFLRAQIR
jgi:hypothetical protein